MSKALPSTSSSPARPGLLGGLFQRRAVARATARPEPVPAGLPDFGPTPTPGPEGGIAYDPLLVQQLVQEHRDLVRRFSAISAPLEESRFEVLPALLDDFKAAFDRHLLAENVRFYCYLEEQARRQHPGRREAIRAFRREMNEIARKVSTFARTWLATPPDAPHRDAFGEELAKVGGLLLQRIRREEQSLYPLYAPPVPA